MAPDLNDIHHYHVPHVDGLVAGEYPGSMDIAAAADRIRRLRLAGITRFVDLTEPGELLPYDQLLVDDDGLPAARHHRFPVRDVNTPRNPAEMVAILNLIDDARADGHQVYVHCWGGIGRTGTAVGCALVRHGMTGDEALAEVARLFGATAKGRRGRVSPETKAQATFVRNWGSAEPPDATESSRIDRMLGAFIGLAAGDALGTTVEFRTPGSFTPLTTIVGGGPFGLAPGQWTDDTSMALCLADSLLERGGFDPRDQMERYWRWFKEGYRSSTGRLFDIGNTVRGALERFRRSNDPFSGSTHPDTAGNGSLMRLSPVVIHAARRPREAVRLAGESSRTTHGAATVVDACRAWAALLLGAFRGLSKDELLDPDRLLGLGFWHDHPLNPAVAGVLAGSYRTKAPPAIRGTGYVVASMEAALWAFHNTETFEAGALAAVNLGEDADTTGAIYGQLAGAFYGLNGIPEEWVAVLHGREELLELGRRLAAGPTPA